MVRKALIDNISKPQVPLVMPQEATTSNIFTSITLLFTSGHGKYLALQLLDSSLELSDYPEGGLSDDLRSISTSLLLVGYRVDGGCDDGG